MFVDTHAHLFASEFEGDVDDVVRRAEDAGVDFIVCPGTDLETSRKSVELAERYDCIFAAVGVHPHDARKAVREDGRVDPAVLEEIEKLSHHPKVVAIGEIGLDYHYNFSPPDAQRVVFSDHIALARKRALPIIVHTREAEADVLGIVQEQMEEDKEWRGSESKGVFHCFPGDPAMARKVIGWGFYVSIPGPVTFPVKPGKVNSMVEVVRDMEVDQLLLETDSPYLTPHPFRGRRNEPAKIPIIAARIAELKGTSAEEVGTHTSAAARRLFGFPPAPRRADV